MRFTFRETPEFRESAEGLIDDETLRAIQNQIAERPDAGDVIAKTGGVRKLRVKLPGRGKSAGARLLYFVHHECDRVYLLFAYPKSLAEDVSEAGKRLLRAKVREIEQGGCR